MTERPSHLIRAESPGPSLSKLVPKMGDMAKILYLIYAALTVIQTAALIIAGLSPFDALIHALGTAGTGGFSNYTTSFGHFHSAWADGITTLLLTLSFLMLLGRLEIFPMLALMHPAAWRKN